MTRRGGAAPAAQDVLAHHELPLYSPTAPGAAGTRVGRVGAGRPFPGVAEEAIGGDGRPRMWRTRREHVLVQEVVAFAVGECDRLPLGFRGQPHAGPIGERIGFVVADVADGLVQVDRTRPANVNWSRSGRDIRIARPGERCLPVLRVDDRPPVGEPELGSAVAVVLMNESHSPHVTGRSARPKGVRWTVWRGYSLSNPKRSPRCPTSTWPPACSSHPAFGGGGRRPTAVQIRRMERVARQDVLDVHQEKLLVLLLMMEAEGDQVGQARLIGVTQHVSIASST